jgi:DNA-directed RNA polymerase specialized sigma24 family protein
MSFAARRDFDAWFSENYEDLVQTSFALHPDAYDLVHHTYLSVCQALDANPKIADNFGGYVHTALWKFAQRDFRKLYHVADAPQKELVSDYDLRDAIRKEEALLMANHLKWFDRKVLELYLEGWSMAELARESGINRSTLYESISQSKKKLRDVIRQRTKEGR